MAEAKKQAPRKQQFNVYLAPDLVRQLKHVAIERDSHLSDLVAEIFRNYLKQLERKRK